MTRLSHFFDIHSAKQLFALLKAVAANFSSSKGKRTQDLLFLIFGLTHLREWIAPGYDHRREPVTREEHFFQDLYKFDDFKTLQALCNHSKHMEVTRDTATLHDANIDEWPEIDSVLDVEAGPPTIYYVGGQNVENVIHAVIAFYEKGWFSRNRSQQ